MPEQGKVERPLPLFIVLEGGEGGGKTTLARVLGRRLMTAGYGVVLTRDPGGTKLGRSFERWLKSAATPVPGPAELLMFAGARSLLTTEVILPGLNSGKVVISDRYWPSSMAYQAYGRGVDAATVMEVNRVATRGVRPDLVVLLDVPVEAGLARKHDGRRDRFHQEDIEFHHRVRAAYADMCAADSDVWMKVDAELPPTSVARLVWSRISIMLQTRMTASNVSHV